VSTPRVRVRRLPVYTFEEWRLAFHPNYFRAGERRAAGAEVRAGERRAAGAEVRAGAAGGASAPEPIELSRDADVADLLGGLMCERTRHGRGKLGAPARRICAEAELRALYDAEVAAGRVPMMMLISPLREESAADAAYARAQARRAARRAERASGGAAPAKP